jgi:hypothetical protein
LHLRLRSSSPRHHENWSAGKPSESGNELKARTLDSVNNTHICLGSEKINPKRIDTKKTWDKKVKDILKIVARICPAFTLQSSCLVKPRKPWKNL